MPNPHTRRLFSHAPEGEGVTHTGYPQTARTQDDDVIWEFTDQGLAALDLNALMQSAEARDN